MWWLITLPQGKTAEHWAYVLNPPLLHPHTWVDEEITVYVNDTISLGLPSSRHINPLSVSYNYTGVSLHEPICFTKQVKENCIQLSPKDNVDDSSRNPGIHWDVEYLYPKFNKTNETSSHPSPPNVKLCGFVKHNPSKPDWRTCKSNVSVCNTHICDWAPVGADGAPKDLIGGLFTSDHRHFFSSIWRLGAALGNVSLGRANVTTNMNGQYDKKNVSILACVPEPYVLLVGNFSVNLSNSIYNLSCSDCNITNCVTQGIESVVILKQPSFVMLPVKLSQPWHKEKSEAVLEKIVSELNRSKRFIGMMVTGIVALVTLVASASASAVALTQGVNTAHFVNQLMVNITAIMTTQEEWDRKIEQKLNILYDTVNIIGDELQQLETLQRLQCHYEFSHVCVTKALYNRSEFSWSQIKNHLQGIWHNSNTSLDLLRLHSFIKGIQDTSQLDATVADSAANFLNSLRNHFLNVNHWMYSILEFGIELCLVVICSFALCIVLRFILSYLKILLVSSHKHQLQIQELARL